MTVPSQAVGSEALMSGVRVEVGVGEEAEKAEEEEEEKGRAGLVDMVVEFLVENVVIAAILDLRVIEGRGMNVDRR